MTQQLTLTKDDQSVVEKMKAIQELNKQREEIEKDIKCLCDIEQIKDSISGIIITVRPEFQPLSRNFQLPSDFMEDVVRQMLAYYKGVDEILIDEAKQLMK